MPQNRLNNASPCPPAQEPVTFGLSGETFLLRPSAQHSAKKNKRTLNGAAIKSVLKYIFYFGLMLVLWISRVNGLSPFATGLYYALLYVGQNCFVLTPLYIVSACLGDLTLETFLGALITGCVLFAFSLTAKLLKKEVRLPVMMAVSIVSQIGYMYFSYAAGAMVLIVLLNLLLSLLFFYVSVTALRPVFKFQLKFRLLDVEIACIGILTAAAAIGLSALNVGNFRFIYLIAYFCILFITAVVGKNAGIAVGLCFGIGAAFYGYDVTQLALLGFVALTAVVFLGAPRILTVLSGLFALILFELYFNAGYETLLYDMLSLSVGGLMYTMLPRGVIDHIKEYYFLPHNKIAARHLVNRNRRNLSQDLEQIGAIFTDMSGLLSPSEDADAAWLGGEAGETLRGDVCRSCPQFSSCSGKNLTAAIEQLTEVTAKKGRAYVTDLPMLIELSCTQIVRLIATAHNLLTAKTAAIKKRKEDNALKAETVRQLSAVTAMLNAAAGRIKQPVSYDPELEGIIMEELSNQDIICSEVLLTREAPVSVTLIAREECVQTEKVCAVLERILKIPLSCDSVSDSQIAGYSVLSYLQKPPFDAVFGVASSSKRADATGDTHSFLRIGSDRFMMALSDGMGHGKEAGRVSDAAISLIESFYRAGFSSELILSTVNRFLIYAEGDAFSALDILVVNLGDLSCDIIKTGTPASYLVRGGEVMCFDGQSLPMGMVSEMSPSVYTHTLQSGDYIVFTSDGVADCFGEGSLAANLSAAENLNPKTLAENILKQAVAASSGKAKDDMTVLVCRILDR